WCRCRGVAVGHRRLRAPGADQHRGLAAGAGHEPAPARLPDDRAQPGAPLRHRPPRRRPGPGDHLHASSPHPGPAVAALPSQHPPIVATVDASVATVIVVLLLSVAEAPRATLVAGGSWRSCLTVGGSHGTGVMLSARGRGAR